MTCSAYCNRFSACANPLTTHGPHLPLDTCVHHLFMHTPAAALAAWDRQILSNRHALLEVEGELKGVAAGQEALERKLFLLETHQKVRALPQGAAWLAPAGARSDVTQAAKDAPCTRSALPQHRCSIARGQAIFKLMVLRSCAACVLCRRSTTH